MTTQQLLSGVTKRPQRYALRASAGVGWSRSVDLPVRSRWLSCGLCVVGVAMIPWLFVLVSQLPNRTVVTGWSTAWVGLDCLEAVGLISTGVLLARGDDRAGLVAMATATVLLIDAWFDVITAANDSDRAVAIAMALLAELPMSVICASLAVRLSRAAR